MTRSFSRRSGTGDDTHANHRSLIIASPREVEVLPLVAQELTDAQIAESMVISPRTVNTHLTSIYGKIQVSSRAATRYAIEHHLL